jgi:hypothetical protein
MPKWVPNFDDSKMNREKIVFLEEKKNNAPYT